MKDNRPPSALIITSLPVEFNTVVAYMNSEQKKITIHAITGYYGTFQDWNIITIITSSDNDIATFQTEYAIKYFQPEIILFIGIAGSLKENVHTGDVVVATKIYSYGQSPKEESIRTRLEIATMNYALIQQAHLEAKNPEWLRHQGEHSTEKSLDSAHTPQVILAPIIAGEKGIPTTSNLYNTLRSSYGDAVAIEMEGEGYGFLSTIQANLLLHILVIRGITEPLDDKKRVDSHSASAATHHACAFAFQLLATLGRTLQSQQLIEIPTLSPTHPKTPSFPSVNDGKPEPLEIFFAYAEEDEKFVQHLQPHLSIFKRTRVITNWHSDSTAGEKILKKQIQYINNASIILLFISPDFLYSDYLLMIAQRAMKRQRTNGVTVIPVLLRRTDDWRGTFFGNLPAIPRGDRPVAEFRDLDLAIKQIASEIRTAAEKVKESRFLNSRF
jgi:nucleoside phosphorylase